ncbi:phosphopantetheine-binding protein [Streptomyces sp. NPDC046876]|uniref:acyl carrier protein n=1 Tax=Streptomyces sp. NPDC046876 TaxID=3155616 RepID=UPI0033F21CB7
MATSTHASHALSAVTGALALHTGAEEHQIKTEERLALIPGIESVKLLRAVADIEDGCGVLIPDDFAFETATVQELADCVAHLLAGAGS